MNPVLEIIMIDGWQEVPPPQIIQRPSCKHCGLEFEHINRGWWSVCKCQHPNAVDPATGKPRLRTQIYSPKLEEIGSQILKRCGMCGKPLELGGRCVRLSYWSGIEVRKTLSHPDCAPFPDRI